MVECHRLLYEFPYCRLPPLEYRFPHAKWHMYNNYILYLPYVYLICVDFHISHRIIIGSDRPPETKQGIEGKIDRFRSGRVSVRVRDRVRVRYNWSPIWTRSPIWSYQFWRLLNSDRRSEPNKVLLHIIPLVDDVYPARLARLASRIYLTNQIWWSVSV